MIHELETRRRVSKYQDRHRRASLIIRPADGPLAEEIVRVEVADHDADVKPDVSELDRHHQPTHDDASSDTQIITNSKRSFDCVALNVSPDPGERVMLSGDRAVIEEAFPESSTVLIDPRKATAWSGSSANQLVRFPLNGFCKITSVQAIRSLLNAGFSIAASSGGGVEGQSFSEYIFVRERA
jgi:hypothetical protein